MIEWCTQNLRRDGSSFMWHQPCNNQIALSITPFRWILKIRAMKEYSHSFRIACDMNAVSLLESREQRYIKATKKKNL